MAKQSGIHQLRGKVGEHSYYRQTGISSGLVRQINQGMSERVKTDLAYANTRLNNAEFGAAGNVASLLGKLVNPKFRPMILPFSQSIMAKRILELAKSSTADWGKRVVTNTDNAALADILTDSSKKAVSDFLQVTIDRTNATEIEVTLKTNASQSAIFRDMGADSVLFNVVQYDVATGRYNNVKDAIQKGYVRVRESWEETKSTATDIDTYNSLNVAPFQPTPELFYGQQFVVVVVMPQRTINNEAHILQEHCMFAAYPIPS